MSGFWTLHYAYESSSLCGSRSPQSADAPSAIKTMREYAEKRGWNVALQIKEVGSGAKTQPQREELLRAERQWGVEESQG